MSESARGAGRSGPYVGRALPHLEDARLVTGAERYTDDIHLAKEVHAAFVRSPHAHAAIRNIDAARARALAAAINAVVDALSEYGVEHIEMPATPARVWAAIRERRR